MKLNLYCLENDRTHAMVRVSAQRSDAEQVVEYLQILAPFGLTVQSSQIWLLGTIDDETFEIVPCARRQIPWTTVDYEQSLPEMIVRGLKKQGSVPSDAPVVDADSIQRQLDALSAAVGKLNEK